MTIRPPLSSADLDMGYARRTLLNAKDSNGSGTIRTSAGHALILDCANGTEIRLFDAEKRIKAMGRFAEDSIEIWKYDSLGQPQEIASDWLHLEVREILSQVADPAGRAEASV